MSKNVRLVTRLALALTLMLAVTITLSGVALAHSRLQSSTPSDGEVLTAEPASVSSTFSEEASVSQSYMQVFMGSARVDNGDGKIDANDRTKMSVTLKPGMGDGVYTVKWHTVTEDDNGIVDGSFSFTVKSRGTASGPTNSTGTMQESGGNSSTLPTTGNGDFGLMLLAAALGLFTLGAGLTLRRASVRR